MVTLTAAPDESPEPQPTETVTADDAPPKPTKPTDTVDFWKAKAREQETRAKANAEAALRLKDFEDRDKTEAQKLLERAEAAERRVAETETRALRLEVAAEKGLTPAQAKRLVGASRAELEADADELLETFKPADPGQVSLDLGQRATSTLPLNGDPIERALRKKLGIT